MAHEGQPEGRTFLAQAQESARRGALLINELRMNGKDSPGPEGKPASADAPGSGTQEPAVAAPPASLEGSERILLVEDDEPVRLLIRAVLTYRGYEVVEAGDGLEAVSQYRQRGPFDLAILDLHMPKLDGRAALEQLRALNPQLRALALSGSLFDCEHNPADPSVHGFDARLNKPFENTVLVALVRELLNRKRVEPAQGPPV
jgi:two-component system cell cycle sensor histidine kinase/response regulator CckA